MLVSPAKEGWIFMPGWTWNPGEGMTIGEGSGFLSEEHLEGNLGRAAAGASPFLIDMYEEGDALFIEADLPAVELEDIDISIQNDHLIINTQRSSRREEEEGKTYYVRERAAGTVRSSRSIALPRIVDADRAEAAYEEGILRIRLPLAPDIRPRRISAHRPPGDDDIDAP
jgi:HSP20 family protein